MPTNISFSDLKQLSAPPEIVELKKKMDAIEEIYTEHTRKNMLMVEEFSGIIKYLLNDVEKELIIPVPIIQDKLNPKALSNVPSSVLYPKIQLKISAKRTTLEDASVKYGTFGIPTFSPVAPINHVQRDFSTLFFKDDEIYNKICAEMNEHGQDIMPKIKEVYKSMELPEIMWKTYRYGINNVSIEEKEIFNIRSESAAFFITFEPRSIFWCVSNNGSPYGQPYPSFDRHVFLSTGGHGYLMEKAFILKHYDDIMNGLNLFEKHKITMVAPHQEYLNFVTKLTQKYTMLNRF